MVGRIAFVTFIYLSLVMGLSQGITSQQPKFSGSSILIKRIINKRQNEPVFSGGQYYFSCGNYRVRIFGACQIVFGETSFASSPNNNGYFLVKTMNAF